MAWPASRAPDERSRESPSDRRGGADAVVDGGDLAVRSVRTSHGRIAFSTTAGGGTPLVLLHGRSRCKAEFRRLMASSVGEERTMVAIDLPGHGGSGAASDPDHTYTIEGYADAVIEVLEHLGIERAAVLGRSIGGHVGLRMACAFPGFAGLLVDGDDTVPELFQPDVRVASPGDLAGGRGVSRRARRRSGRLPNEDEALGPALHVASRSDDRYRRLPPFDPVPTAADLAAMRHAVGGERPFMRSLREHPSPTAATDDAGYERPLGGSSQDLLRFLSHVDRVSPGFPLLGLCLSG